MKLLNILALTALSLLFSMNVSANKVGVLAGLRGEVFVERNGQEIPSTGGHAILPGDHIRTHGDQIFQLILLDETVFTFAGNVDISLDVFEYDKTSSTGRLQITQYAGLMKYTTGHIANGKVGFFRIKQPHSDIAVLGTTGVVGMLSPEQAAKHFPQIQLPQTDDLISYAALMGPGPRAARWVKSGAFQYSNDQGTVDLNRPGGSVLAVAGGAPVVFVAPPLDISQATSYDDENKDDTSNSGDSSSTGSKDKSSSGQTSTVMDFGDLSGSLPSVSNSDSTSLDAGPSSDTSSSSALRDMRNLLDSQSMNEIIRRLEETQGIPGQGGSVDNPVTDPVIDPVTDPVTDPGTGGGGIICPGDPSCPVDPAPTDPGTGGGVVCPGDPSCPVDPAPTDPGTGGGMVCPGDPSCPVDPAPTDPGTGGGMVCPGDPGCPIEVFVQ